MSSGDNFRIPGAGEKQQLKQVWYSGTDTLSEGMLLCYKRAASPSPTLLSTTGATYNDVGRAWEVVKPATAYLNNFAGVVVGSGITGPGIVTIAQPGLQALVNILAAVNTTAGTTKLGVQNGSYNATTASASVPFIGLAFTTSTYGSTANLVQVQLDGVSPANGLNQAAVVTAVTKATGSTVGATQEEVLLSTTMTDATGATVGATQEEILLSPNTLADDGGTTGGTYAMTGSTIVDTTMKTATQNNLAKLVAFCNILRNDDAKVVKVVNLLRDDTAKLATQLNAVITALKNARIMAT